jgi:hypothetical protein
MTDEAQAALSTHIRLAAGLIASTLFLLTASLLTVGFLIAATMEIRPPAGKFAEFGAMFLGGLSLLNIVFFYWRGLTGLGKVMAGYKEIDKG